MNDGFDNLAETRFALALVQNVSRETLPTASPITLELAARAACVLEVSVRKPGNVHAESGSASATHDDFLRSADAVSGAVQRVFYEYADFRSVVKENIHLKEELRHARIQALQNASVAASNRVLHELLDYRQSLPMSAMAAHVVARDVTDLYRSVIIGKGGADGIQFGMPVICPEGLVGRVSETSAHGSQIQLVTDTQSALAVMLDRKSVV